MKTGVGYHQNRANRQTLTVREIEILTLFKEGYVYKEIAYKLNLTVATVKSDMRFILIKLDAVNSTHAVTLALKKGLIGLHDEGVKG